MKNLLALLVALIASSNFAASVTVGESAKIFSKPGYGPVLGTVKVGTVLDVVEAYPMWYEIEYQIGEVKRVWINVWNDAAPRDCDPCTPVVTRSGDMANVDKDRWARITPNLKSEPVGGVPAGTSAKIVAERPLHYLVDSSAGRGYVEASRVTVN